MKHKTEDYKISAVKYYLETPNSMDEVLEDTETIMYGTLLPKVVINIYIPSHIHLLLIP